MATNILEYVQEHASPQSLQKGQKLVKAKKVLSLSYNVNARAYDAKIQGSKVYNVLISCDSNNVPTNTFCNCPYDWSGLCKHEIAVLLTMNKSPEVLKKIESSTKVIHEKKTLLPNNEELSENFLKKYVSLNFINTIRKTRWKVSIDEFEGPNSMSISLVNKAHWDDEFAIIKLNRLDQGIEVDCSCHLQKAPFCEHVAFVLDHFLNVANTPSLLRLLEPDFYQKQLDKALDGYGIDTSNSSAKAIKMVAKNGQLIYSLSSKYRGMTPIMGAQGENFNNYFKEHIFATNSEEFQLSQIVDAATLSDNTGFGIVFNYCQTEYQQHFSVNAVTGKLNKKGDKLTSAIQVIELETLPLLERNQQQVVNLLIELRETTDNIDFSDEQIAIEDYTKVLTLLKQLFNITSTNDLIYLRNDYFEPYNTKISNKSLVSTTVNNSPASIEFELVTSEEFIELNPILIINNKKILLTQAIIKEHCILDLLFHWNNNLHLIDSVQMVAVLRIFQQQEKLKTTINHADELIRNFVIPLSKNFNIDMSKAANLGILVSTPTARKRCIYINEMNDFVTFSPIMEYEGAHLQNILDKGNQLIVSDNNYSSIVRDMDFEKSLYDLIKTLHPNFQKQFPDQFFYIKTEDMIKEWWFLKAFEKLQEENIEVFGFEKLKNFKYNLSPAKVNTSIASGVDWFEVDMEIVFGDVKASLAEVKKAVLKKEQFIRLSNGTFGVLPEEWFKKFEHMFRQGEVKDGILKIASNKFMVIDSLFNEIDNEEVRLALKQKMERLQNFSSIKKIKTPKQINATLRDYQREGLNWMNFLNEYQWGGILADDMGLGKTLQVLSLLITQKNKSKKTNLIVVPTTLIFNWENEIAKFCPSIKAHYYHGIDRKKDHSVFKDFDVVITTYGTMVNDIETLKKHTFNYIILDESQAIKNTQSLRFKAVRLLKGKNKLALTGTPIENNTFDLYAQMQFVNPGLLGSAKSFKDQFSQPIDKDNDAEIAAELRNLISPFMIRRTKEQVATELPPKTEEVLFCTMEKQQRKVYDAFRNKYRDYLMGKIEEDGIEKSKIYVLEGLTKLRQICDSPAILNDEQDYGNSSIKTEELMRNIREKTGQHKIVVFSQFVKMLKVIEARLIEENIAYEYLDGESSQKARKNSVNNFQEDKKCRVFLISLKAGGTGLNLTAADYVFLVDPWWNPAVENQAIDRCYRIGQDKKVFAYRMICKDTIEEKIIGYQKKKQAVASEIIKAEENFMKQLTFEDIKNLFD